MALDKAKIVEDLSNATVIEIADLVKELENKWGVTAAAPVAVAAAGGPAAGAAAGRRWTVAAMARAPRLKAAIIPSPARAGVAKTADGSSK